MAYYTGEYVYAKSCTSGPQTGAKGAMAWYLAAYKSKNGTNGGIYNCRSVRGGGSTSIHSEGRALDFMVPVGAKWAQKLANAIVNMSKELGVQIVIYNRKIWVGGSSTGLKGFQSYGGTNPHVDHLHVELTWEMARKSEQDVLKLWASVLAEASTETPTSKENGNGEGVGDGEKKEEKKKKDTPDTSELYKGIPGEDELEGMENYKKRLEQEKSIKSGKIPENATSQDLTLTEQKRLTALSDSMNSGKTASDYANLGVSVAGVGLMLFTVLLFASYLFDRSNTLIEGQVTKKLTFNKLGVAYVKEEVGKSESDGIRYLSWWGIAGYCAVGMILALFLVNGMFFTIIENSITLWNTHIG